MAEAFPVSGNIEPSVVPPPPRGPASPRGHGLAQGHRPGPPQGALLPRRAAILFGSSNDPRDQLGAILIESGRITREQLDEVNAKVGPGQPARQGAGRERLREPARARRSGAHQGRADPGRRAGLGLGHLRVRGRRAAQGRRRPQALDREAAARGGAARRRPRLRAAPRRALDRARAGARGRDRPLRGAGRGLAAARAARRPAHAQGRDRASRASTSSRPPRPPARCSSSASCASAGAASGEELDLAEEAQSGFGAEPAPMYTVPIEAIREASLPDSEPTGFAFAEPEPAFPAGRADLRHRDGGARREPGRDRHAPGRLRGARAVPRHSPRRADRDPRGPELHDGRSVAAQGHRHGARRPARLRAPAGAGTGRRARGLHAGRAVHSRCRLRRPAQASRPTQEDLAALDALLNPSASGQLGKSPVERPRPEKWEPQFRPPTTPPRKAPAAPRPGVALARAVHPAAAIGGVVLATVGRVVLLPARPAAVPRPGPLPTAQATPAPPTTTLAAAPAPTASPVTSPPRPQRRLRCRARRPRRRRSRRHRRLPLHVPRRPPRPTPTPRATPAPVAPAGDPHALLRAGRAPRGRPCVRGPARAGRPRPLHACSSSWPARRRPSRRP